MIYDLDYMSMIAIIFCLLFGGTNVILHLRGTQLVVTMPSGILFALFQYKMHFGKYINIVHFVPCVFGTIVIFCAASFLVR